VLTSYADWRSPAETGCRAAAAPRRFAPAVRVGLPSNRSLSEDFTALGEPANVCRRMSSRLQKLSTVPLYELDAVMCTDLGRQQPVFGPAMRLVWGRCGTGRRRPWWRPCVRMDEMGFHVGLMAVGGVLRRRMEGILREQRSPPIRRVSVTPGGIMTSTVWPVFSTASSDTRYLSNSGGPCRTPTSGRSILTGD
jgi:hypothetical protein